MTDERAGGTAVSDRTDATTSTAGTSISPDAAAVWRAVRGPLILAAAIVLVVSGLVLLTGGRDRGALDPRAVDKAGSRALAELLRREGIDVVLATTPAQLRAEIEDAPEKTTLLIPFPDRLNDEQRESAAVLNPARTVLIAPGDDVLETFGIDARDAGTVDRAVIDPLCDLPAALRAGDVDLGGNSYLTNVRGTVRCYPEDGGPSLLVVPRADGDTVLLGTGALMRNDRLDEHGNASLSMQLLGEQPTLVWYLPDESAGGDDEGLLQLLPDGWRFGVGQLGIAVVLLALYRARRLGPVVTEPLPVVVRATETAEGRARLYRRGRAVDRASEELRTAARARLAARLGLGTGSGTAVRPEALVDAVAARTGRPPADVQTLLYGAIPGSEDGLVALADHLDLLEEHVKTGVRQP